MEIKRVEGERKNLKNVWWNNVIKADVKIEDGPWKEAFGAS